MFQSVIPIKDNLSSETIKELEAFEQSIDRDNVTIGLFGAIASGKSTFLNALVGEKDLFRQGLGETTKVVTAIRPAVNGNNDVSEIVYSDGNVSIMSHSEADDLTNNEEAAQKIKERIIYLDKSKLHESLVLYDSPGFSSNFERHTRVSQELAEKCDGFVLVIDPELKLSRVSGLQAFIQHIKKSGLLLNDENVVFILNKTDALSDNQTTIRNEEEKIKDQIRDLFGFERPVIISGSCELALWSNALKNRKKLTKEEIVRFSKVADAISDTGVCKRNDDNLPCEKDNYFASNFHRIDVKLKFWSRELKKRKNERIKYRILSIIEKEIAQKKKNLLGTDQIRSVQNLINGFFNETKDDLVSKINFRCKQAARGFLEVLYENRSRFSSNAKQIKKVSDNYNWDSLLKHVVRGGFPEIYATAFTKFKNKVNQAAKDLENKSVTITKHRLNLPKNPPPLKELELKWRWTAMKKDDFIKYHKTSTAELYKKHYTQSMTAALSGSYKQLSRQLSDHHTTAEKQKNQVDEITSFLKKLKIVFEIDKERDLQDVI